MALYFNKCKLKSICAAVLPKFIYATSIILKCKRIVYEKYLIKNEGRIKM